MIAEALRLRPLLGQRGQRHCQRDKDEGCAEHAQTSKAPPLRRQPPITFPAGPNAPIHVTDAPP